MTTLNMPYQTEYIQGEVQNRHHLPVGNHPLEVVDKQSLEVVDKHPLEGVDKHPVVEGNLSQVRKCLLGMVQSAAEDKLLKSTKTTLLNHFTYSSPCLLFGITSDAYCKKYNKSIQQTLNMIQCFPCSQNTDNLKADTLACTVYKCW